MTSDTTFSELGLSSRGYITIINDDTRTILTIKTADTIAGVISKLNSANILAELNNGKLTLTPNKKSVYISGISENIANTLLLEGDFYSTSLGVEMTDSNMMTYNGATTIRNSTTLSKIGVTTGELLVKKDNQEYKTISVDESQSVYDLIHQLQDAGFNATCKNGSIQIKADGDMYLTDGTTNSSNVVSLFALNNVQQTIESTYANTSSDRLEKLNEIVNKYWQASGAITLQIGIYSDENSSIEIDTGFTLKDFDKFANIGKKTVNSVDYIKELDEILECVFAKQTELGAYENRLESALEEITIKYDNLVSSRSTLRDADMAELSSIYIQQQILQNASATLLAVANQTPQLALQLL